MEEQQLNQPAWRLMMTSLGVSSKEEQEWVAFAVMKADRKFPGYFSETPKNAIDHCKLKIFELQAGINYLEYHTSHAHIDHLKRELHYRQMELLMRTKPTMLD